jgi:cold shock CspA family protein
MSNERYTGRIKFWNGVKAYGFIRMTHKDAMEDVFFATSDLVNPFHRPFKGDRVRFQLTSNRNGFRAYNVERIET